MHLEHLQFVIVELEFEQVVVALNAQHAQSLVVGGGRMVWRVVLVPCHPARAEALLERRGG